MDLFRKPLISAVFVVVLVTMATSSWAAAMPESADELLQFSAGGHVLGFNPGEVYLASMDHVLRVEFVGGNQVTPVAERESSPAATESKGAAKLQSVSYSNLWDDVTLVYERSNSGVVKSTYHVKPGARIANRTAAIRFKYNVPVDIGRVLRYWPLVQHEFIQKADCSCEVNLLPIKNVNLDLEQIATDISRLFGKNINISVKIDESLRERNRRGKVKPYRIEM